MIKTRRGMSGGDRDWAQLPPELLGSIAERLMVEDYTRFGAVCASWASAASPSDGLYLPLAPQMPLLLVLGDEGGRGESCTLVSLPDRRRRRITPFPEFRGKWCIGSQSGWVAMMDERSEVSLMNLLTRARIRLPSVTTFPGVNPVYNPDGSLSGEYLYSVRLDWEPVSYTLAEFRCVSFKKVVLSSRPTAGRYTAMAIFSVINKPAMATAGGEKWALLPNAPIINDVIYRDGKFLAVSYNAELWALDIAGPTMIGKGLDIDCTSDDKYLVDSPGDLLLARFVIKDNFSLITAIEVMKFDHKRPGWVPLKTLGDDSLFLGLCYSISLSAREIPELKRNCIYFTEVLWDWLPEEHKDMVKTRDVGVFNLEDGSFDRYCPLDPRMNWPPPLWIAPSLL